MKTIVALATPPMNGAIHIIRISGNDAFNIINNISKQKISKRGYEMQKVNIVDKNKQIIDHVIINKFVSPHSFTGEDSIEINCHGGYYLAQQIINLLISYGCIMAKPGEFSQRAFMNNKLSLIEAQAINNLINATNNTAIKLANQGFNNELLKQLQLFREQLFLLIGQVEVNIDYPEFDDVPEISHKRFQQILKSLITKMTKIVTDSKKIIPYIEGINVAIIGKPNVGKSSLLNAILNQPRAIVTDIPGTTTDIISERANINGITFNFMDTAGIRITNKEIESLGVGKTQEIVGHANLLLFVVDGSKPLTKDDKQILSQINNKKHLIVINKIDLANKVNIKGIKVSAKLNQTKDLINAISKMLTKVNVHENLVLQNSDSIAILENVINKLTKINQSIKNSQTIDLYMEDLHSALKGIDSILGISIEFVDELFKNFCVGK
jgi:tRNA modification GTPase